MRKSKGKKLKKQKEKLRAVEGSVGLSEAGMWLVVGSENEMCGRGCRVEVQSEIRIGN
jgi:hypothetical protein